MEGKDKEEQFIHEIEVNEDVEKFMEKEKDNDKNSSSYQCSQCGTIMKTRKKLGVHVHYHHKDLTSCHLCPLTFHSKEKARRHIQEVHHTFFTNHLCPECGKQFHWLGNMVGHQRDVHSTKELINRTVKPPTEHQCTMCDKKFTERQQLNQHIKRKHQVIIRSGSAFFLVNVHAKYSNHQRRRTWICMSCNKLFTKGNDLARHNLCVHKVIHAAREATVLICNICNTVCMSRQVLGERQIKQHPNGAYSCDHCNKGFTTKRKLYYHK